MRTQILNTPVDLLSLDQTIARAELAMRTRRRCQHVALNVAKLVNMRWSANLHRDVVEADIIGIDGAGICLAGWLLGMGRLERVAGIDLMHHLLRTCAEKGYRPYIFGAKQDVLDRAIYKIRQQFPTIEIAGYRNGYFNPSDEPDIIAEIRASKADCLFVAIVSPIKERFARSYRNELGVPFVMGVGGSVDVLAGLVKRAPNWVQRCGLEWAYRISQDPWRLWKRYFVTNSVFALLLAQALIKRLLQPLG